MAALADLERLFERLFEQSTARLFRARTQPVQLERRVERAMERARSTRDHRTFVPAHYRVRLDPADLTDVADQAGGAVALAGRLADAALGFARSHGYQLPGRPIVALVADPSVQRGVIEVDAVAAPSSAPTADVDVAPGLLDMPTITPRPMPAAVVAEPAPEPAVRPAAPSADPDIPRAGGIRGDGGGTLAFRKPAPAPTRAVLRVVGRDGGERTVEVDGAPLTVGRAADNGLALADPRVSRHHCRLQARRGTLVLTDLASTNGSRVNGVRVDECALGSGDRILVGDTVLLVEQLPG